MFAVNSLTLNKINGAPPVRWAEFEVDNFDDPETVANVRAALVASVVEVMVFF